MKKATLLQLFFLTLTFGGLFAQTEAEREEIRATYDLEKLNQLQIEMTESFNLNYQEALTEAARLGWELSVEQPNGGISMLVGIKEDGSPKYYTTTNREGAITTRANKIHTGGGAGLDLNGENMILGVWDGGRVQAAHPLLENRVDQIDNPGSISDHSTHVSGTMIGTGSVVGGAAKGMAPLANIRAFDFFSDSGEMVGEAANGMLVSNHSYGMNIANAQLWELGFYSNDARGVDNISFNAPYYLSVWSAGNDRQSGANTGDGGYDYLTDSGTAKNNIVVAATFEVLNYTGPNSVNMSSFSSWGPTDDGRVKPDISAKGVNMYSSVGTSQYANYSGTSMAAPNTSGSLILLQQHYNELYGSYMRSSTLRGLALHTADETGNSDGPDYRFGWGLLNVEKAAQVISDEGVASIIKEEVIENGEVYTFSVQADGVNDLVVSVTWLDPPGIILPVGIEDVATPSLINDLDLRVSQDGGATFYPWKLDPANFTAAATTGDNIIDNIEKVEIAGATGEYIIQVSHKGAALTNDLQAFSLIVSGITNEQFAVTSLEGIKEACSTDSSASFDIDLSFSDGFSDTIDFTVSNLPAGTTGSITPASLNTDGTAVLTINGIGSLTEGDYPVQVTATGSSETINLYLILRILGTDVADIALIYPLDDAIDLPVVINFEWELGDSFVDSYDFELSRFADFSVIEESENVVLPHVLILGVTEGAEYFWRVKANTICAEGNFSDIYSFTVAGTLGINDFDIAGLVIYPNPTTETLNIEATSEITSIEIYNVLGQVLISKSNTSNSSKIDVSRLSAGNYFMKVTSENSSNVLQFLKQ